MTHLIASAEIEIRQPDSKAKLTREDSTGVGLSNKCSTLLDNRKYMYWSLSLVPGTLVNSYVIGVSLIRSLEFSGCLHSFEKREKLKMELMINHACAKKPP